MCADCTLQDYRSSMSGTGHLNLAQTPLDEILPALDGLPET